MKIILIFILGFILSSANVNKKVLILGDSLTEGYGVEKDDSYPVILQKKLKELGYNSVDILGAGISGSTSASGLSRLKWLLKSKPKILILALGANDGLRGLDNKQTEKHLSAIIELAQKNQITVILAGMKMPPNFGKKYTEEFDQMYPKLAKKYKIALIPFILEGVAGEKGLNLADGIHPNEKGHKIMADTVFKHLISHL